MVDLYGRDLEDYGQEVFTRMGLICAHRLNQVRLLDLDPAGSYSADEHLEFDYLIPYEKICIIGEITGRKNASSVESKYRQFRKHYNLLNRLNLDERVWRLLGVTEAHLHSFLEIEEIKGCFIVANLQKFDVDLSKVPNISCFFKFDWDLLVEYSQCIGSYARYHFLQLFDYRREEQYRPLQLKETVHGLMRTTNKKIASDVGIADLYTFEVSPYDLFPMARVYRRDMLPDLSSISEEKYQRPLIPDKLKSIREKLLISRDFMFPNSILAVLTNNCRYSSQDRSLLIPDMYGAISVIDGQHRLFSYADENVRNRLGDNCRIMVTAIQFKDANDEAVQRYSARTFIEINTNQTRVRPTHLDAIAYGILRETSSKAIAAQIILQANEQKGNLYGLFDTNQTSLGIIQTTTVLSTLKSITNLNYIHSLKNSQRGTPLVVRRGYENLFGVTIQDLCDPEILIKQGITCFEHFFNLVATIFSHDWPERGSRKGSSLEFSKMIASFVRLLWQFISEGLDWQAIQIELEKIRANVMNLRGMQNYDNILFNPTDQSIPDAKPSTTDDFHFLDFNRHKSTSVYDTLAQVHLR